MPYLLEALDIVLQCTFNLRCHIRAIIMIIGYTYSGRNECKVGSDTGLKAAVVSLLFSATELQISQ
jgi:hypothetical protein